MIFGLVIDFSSLYVPPMCSSGKLITVPEASCSWMLISHALQEVWHRTVCGRVLQLSCFLSFIYKLKITSTLRNGDHLSRMLLALLGMMETHLFITPPCTWRQLETLPCIFKLSHQIENFSHHVVSLLYAHVLWTRNDQQQQCSTHIIDSSKLCMRKIINVNW